MKLNVQEAASLLGTSDEQVWAWIDEGSLPSQQIRGRHHMNRTELLEWATGRGIAVAPSAFRRPSDAPGIPSIADALRAGGVRHHAVAAPDAAGMFRAVIEAMPLAEEGDRETLLQFALARKGLALSFAGEGIAIPSVRVPTVLARSESLLMLSFFSRPVWVRFPEEHLIHTLFSLVCPTVHTHLAMLAKLTWCLRDDAFRAAILRHAPEEEILISAGSAEEGAR